MMNKNNGSLSIRQGVRAAFFLALAFVTIQPASAQTQWVTNGDNINNTNTGNVGIGIINPLGRLHIRGGYATTGMPTAGAAFYLNATGTSPNAGQLVFGDGTGWKFHFGTVSAGNFVERMTVTDYGRVGIGTTNPSHTLDVVGNGIFQGPGANLSIKNTTGWTQVIAHRSSGQAAFIAVPGVPYSANTPYWAMGLGSDGSAGWTLESYDGLTMANRIRVLPNGNVGIGVTTPSRKLEIAGNSGNVFGAGASTGSTANIDLSGHVQLREYSTGGIAYLQARDDGSNRNIGLRFRTQKAGDAGPSITEAATIDANGNVGIGIINPGYRLDIQGGQINTSGGLCIAGDCKISWSQVGSQWTTSGSNIFYNTGKVGIGTNAPASELHVVGNVTLTRAGNISATGTITAGNIVAKYQDIAEWVPSNRAMPAGTVVVLDTDQNNHVLPSSQAYDTRVAGVVSERPGLILGEGGDGKLLVATTGRVRVKVDATRAPVRAGDILVTSDREGIAMRSEPLDLGGAKIHRPGTIIGKALEPLDKGVGEILVLLSLQ